MCGIAGIVHTDPQFPVSEPLVVAMRDSLRHRGPDDAGHYIGPGIALASRRLAILDLSKRGHMPMTSLDGRYWIVYNGEVYNYRDLRARLEDRGYSFQSNTDTEVLLNLFIDQGPAMLDRLNGMFAVAIWDAVERTLFLARDRLGVKPLYFVHGDEELAFASEEKALFAGGVAARFDSGTWEELLCFRYVAGERTPFLGVRRLLPGHCLLWKDGKISTRRWWDLADRTRDRRQDPPRDARTWFLETFDSAVDLRRISDVPVGVLLSGGIDSSSVAASLSLRAGSGIASFTVRFSEPQYDEGPFAQEVAERWRLQYHELTVSPTELLDRLRHASWLQDEPLAHSSNLQILAISEYAKSRVTVLLSGEGADELLGGYVRYQPLRYPGLLNTTRAIVPRVISALPTNGRLRKLSRFLRLGTNDAFVLFNACDVLPEDLALLGLNPTGRFPFREQVISEARALYPGDAMRQAMYSDQHTHLCSLLDRNDRMTMGASIECRVPFLDYRLVEGTAALPSSVLLAGRRTKHLLRQAVGDRLPARVRNHRKWGFAVPWLRYLRQEPLLRDHVNNLPDLAPIRDGPFDRGRLRGMIGDFLGGNDRPGPLITQLVMTTIWAQACLGGAAHGPEGQPRLAPLFGSEVRRTGHRQAETAKSAIG
jgi:asparagine synthase (glutamine-hydrolysing)